MVSRETFQAYSKALNWTRRPPGRAHLSTPQMTILTGEALAIALASVRKSIALRDVTTRHKIGEINGEQTLVLLASGRVEAVGRGKRLRFLRALDPSVRVPKVRGHFEVCLRTAESAVLWPWVEGRGIAA